MSLPAEAQVKPCTTSIGERGVVATSHPLAARAGLEALERGGSAADAAVAAAAVLCVVDPRSTGIGGDVFALYWPAGEPGPVGLAAAGPAPAALTIDSIRAAGHRAMPAYGPWTITVPGAVGGWETLLARYGRLGLERVLDAAIGHADEGFGVTPMVAEEWTSAVEKLRGDRAAAALFLPGGRPPRSGERFTNAALARTLRAIAADGAAPFYAGAAAEAIGRAVDAAGGPLRAADLAAWAGPQWVEPIATRFAGLDVFELPPPGQGVVVLEALGIYAGLEHTDRAAGEHAAIEALKLAFADAQAFVADPAVVDVPSEALISPAYLGRRRREVDPERALSAEPGSPSDTVYVAVATADAGSCSLIQSLYEGFGSGVGVDELGITLQNRGAGFVLDKGHPNCVAPGKRPYHTIIPAMLGRDGQNAGCLGVVGGFMQPQGQLQILRALLERGEEPDAAVAAPRWRWLEGRRLGLEPGFPSELTRALAARGHELEELSRFEAGGAQLALRRADGYAGASDPRKDGVALAF